MVSTYYNEFDPFAAEWLRELIKAGHIAPGEVDERSIEDVTPSDLHGFVQCHFFAGIGVWSAALRGAGWPDDRPVWTGSCPCQPFSQAGKGAGVDDERHLWPAWFHLIKHGKGAGVPVFGEQVASPDGLTWLDIVLADLEGEKYTARAVDLCSAGFGSPNIRQRLYFHATRDGVAQGDTITAGLQGHHGNEHDRSEPGRLGTISAGPVTAASNAGGMAGAGCDERSGRHTVRHADAQHDEAQGQDEGGEGSGQRPFDDAAIRSAVSGKHPGPTNGFWADVDWLLCRPEPRFPNGAWRPVEPGTFPLVARAPNIMGRLCGYGNGLNKEVAQAFIKAVMQ